MGFTNINHYILSNDDQFQFHTQAKTAMEKSGLTAITGHSLFADYCAGIERIDAIMKKVVKSEYTAQIQDFDGKRDNMFKSMVEITKANIRHYDENIKAAAARLKILFDAYGDISRQSLSAETSAVHNIGQELTGKYSADAKAIHIDGWVGKMSQYNKAVADLMESRFDESAGKITASLRDVRKEVDEIYRAIIKRIEAFMIIDGAANYTDFVNRLNVVISKYSGKKTTSSGDNTPARGASPATPPKEETLQSADSGKFPSVGGVAGASSPDGVVDGGIKQWDAAEDYNQMKIGDRRQTADGRVWEAVDLGQVHRDPIGEHGHFGWKQV